jgi:hypothetical protein
MRPDDDNRARAVKFRGGVATGAFAARTGKPP